MREVWTGLMWLKTGKRDGSLWTRVWDFFFNLRNNARVWNILRVMELRVPLHAENFVISWGTINFSKTTVFHVVNCSVSLLVLAQQPPVCQGLLIFTRFLDHTQRRTTVGRTPLDEWSARRRDLYLTTHNNHNRQTSMPSVGFEPTISAGEGPQTYALDRAATETGS